MAIDEIQAFQRASEVASERGWEWQPPFWINLSDGEWQVQAECERVVRLRVASGDVVGEAAGLDPAAAFSAAKEHAALHGVAWKPSFSLQRASDGWVVGACQSQLGGQVSIHVDRQGVVIRGSVNPK